MVVSIIPDSRPDFAEFELLLDDIVLRRMISSGRLQVNLLLSEPLHIVGICRVYQTPIDWLLTELAECGIPGMTLRRPAYL